MKRIILPALALAAAVWAAVAQSPRVNRATLVAMEKSFDKRIKTISIDLPFDLLGTTRGIYLEGYGAVFTAEVNLAISATLSPFQQTIPKEYMTKLHATKLERVPLLKRNMQETLLAMAASLDTVPAQEQIVLGISLFYWNWEDTAGLPRQIVMQGGRQKLLEVQSGRVNPAALDSIIRVQEF